MFLLIFLTSDQERVIHAFIFSRLDYCNAIYFGTFTYCTSAVSTAQDAAARMPMNARKTDHVTPLLATLR